MLKEVLTDLLAMASRLFKDQRHGVLIQVKDPGASSNAIAFGQRFEYTIDGRFIGVETSKDAIVATTKSPATFHTAIEWSAMGPVTLNQLEILLNGFASVGATQKGWRFHCPTSIEKLG